MDYLKKLSRDEIRSEVSKLNSKLKLIKNVEIKKMKKQQMIDFLMEHESDNPQNKNKQDNNKHNNHKIKEINLGEIFPFEKSIFSYYNEFNGITRYTIYENESNSINFDDYMGNFDKRNFDYFVKIIKKQTQKFLDKKLM